MSSVASSILPLPGGATLSQLTNCIRGRITKRSRDIAKKILQADEQAFTIDGTPIESVRSFQYLGRVESRTDSDWGTLHTNLRRARHKWYKLSKLLHREGANPRIFSMFYKAVVQTVLIFGCESWTLTDAMWNVLKGFHLWAARRMADMMAHSGPGGGWIYPHLRRPSRRLVCIPWNTMSTNDNNA